MNHKELESYLQIYGKDLYSFCCSITRNRMEAEDLYQDTFLKLYELGDRMEIRSNPKSCLMAVSVNLYRNYKRKLAIRKRIAGSPQPVEEASELPSKELGAEEMLVQKEEQQMVLDAVKELPDRYRLPILLFYMEELPLAEISKMLKLPQGTVKSRIYRAKKILKLKLEDVYYGKEYG